MKRAASFVLAILCLLPMLHIGGAKMKVSAEAGYTLEDLDYINCDIIKDEAHRRYVNAMIKYHLVNEFDTRVSDTLKKGKNVIFYFDGASDNNISGRYTDYKRYHFSAVCVVVRLKDGMPQIVFMDDFTSTIPDNPRKPSLNDGTPVPTVVDGILPVTTTNHGGYAALHLQCHNDGDVIRCTENRSYMSSSTGIDIHERSWDYVNSSTYSSTGCFNVGKSVEAGGRYNEFMLVVTGIKSAYYNKFSSTGENVGVAVIDHTLYAEQIKDIYKGDNTRSADEIADAITAYTRSLNVNTDFFASEGHTHTFSEPIIEEAHPHRNYRVCECGYIEVLDDGNEIFDCDICNPLEEDKTYKGVLPFVCYVGDGEKINSFSSAYMNSEGVKLDPNTEYRIDKIYNTSACRITFMSGGRVIEAFVPLSDVVCGAENGLASAHSEKQITTYKRVNGDEYGYVGSGDDIYVSGSENGMTQVFYPISDGKFKLGWVKTNELPTLEFTVTFDANGGKNAPKKLTKKEGAAVILPQDIPNREGFEFVSWNTSKDGSGADYAAGSEYKDDKNLTLYAIWKEKAPEVSEEASEEISELSTEATSEEASEVSAPPSAEENKGASFLVWLIPVSVVLLAAAAVVIIKKLKIKN